VSKEIVGTSPMAFQHQRRRDATRVDCAAGVGPQRVIHRQSPGPLVCPCLPSAADIVGLLRHVGYGSFATKVERATGVAVSAMPRKRPHFAAQENVAMGHVQTHAPHKKRSMFDRLVETREPGSFWQPRFPKALDQQLRVCV
jgi:hypothetical protein